MATQQKQKQPAGHNTYAPPSEEQALHSAKHIGATLLGREQTETNDMVWHFTTVSAYGIALGFPVSVSTGTGPGSEGDVEERAKEEFGKLATAQAGADPAGFDWVTLATLAFQMLQMWLNRRRNA